MGSEAENVEGDVRRDQMIERVAIPTLDEWERPINATDVLKRVEAVNQILRGAVQMSLQHTKTQDWLMLTGKKSDGTPVQTFYLMVTGIEKVAQVWGIYYRNRVSTKDVHADGSYTYHTSGEVGSKLLDRMYGERTIEVEGSRSSKDKFFANRTNLVDENDVRKASYANFQVRGCSTLLGLRNLTADDLREMGLAVDKISKMEFKSGAKGASTPEQKNMKDRIRQWMLEMYVESTFASDKLETMTSFPEKKDGQPTGKMVPGVKQVDNLRGRRVDVTYGKVKSEYVQWCKDHEKEFKEDEPSNGKPNNGAGTANSGGPSRGPGNTTQA